jgi:hypothetical protein
MWFALMNIGAFIASISVMGLRDEEVKSILVQHECCYEERLSVSGLMKE